MVNAIVADSTSGGDCVSPGAPDTNTNTLTEDGSCGAVLSGDPMLAPLGYYGGSTQTHMLLLGSPAIGAGDSGLPTTTPTETTTVTDTPTATATTTEVATQANTTIETNIPTATPVLCTLVARE